MRTFRLPLLAAGGLLAVCVGIGVLAFSPSFQTWLLRRALAGRADLSARVGTVSAGLRRVELREVEWRMGDWQVRVPLLEAELRVLPALWSDRVGIVQLRARGWVVEPVSVPPAVAGTNVGPAVGSAAANPMVPLPATGGLLGRWSLPFDLSLEHAELDGEVRLPAGQGRVLLRIAGGGMAAGRDGRFEIASDAILVAPELNAVTSRAVLTARMNTARSLSRIELEFESSARGARFPAGLEVAGSLATELGPNGETYTARAKSRGRTLLDLRAEYPRDSGRWRGAWQANFTEADLAALVLGLRTPAFAATGGGTFEWAPAQKELQAKGQLAATVDRLDALRPELAALGRLTVTADFDLGGRDELVAVRRFDAAITGGAPVASVRVLQPFAFHWGRREVSAVDPSGELLGITLQGVPVAWLARWLPPFGVQGQAVRGELRVLSHGRGVSVQTASPLTVAALAIMRGEDSLLEGVEVETAGAWNLARDGWALDVTHLSVVSGGRKLLEMAGRAGWLAGAEAALKLTGTFKADLPALLAQPACRRYASLVQGEGSGEVSASLGATSSWHVKVAGRNLALGPSASSAVPLPAVSVDLRADVGGDGEAEYHVPLVIQQGERSSDLLVAGKARWHEGRLEAIEATATSSRLHVEDLRAFAGALIGSQAPDGELVDSGPEERRKAPPWIGWAGGVGFQFEEVSHDGIFRLTHVTGKARLEAGRIRLEALEAGLGQGGRARAKGALMYDSERSQPYGFVVDVNVRDLEPGLTGNDGKATPEAVFEGRFDVSGSVAGRATAFQRLPARAAGAWTLASRGGVFRGLPVTVKVPAGGQGRVAGFLAAAGQAIGGLARRREAAVTGSRAEAVAEFAAALNPITFDQLSLRFVHEAGSPVALTDFTLIAPELRLSGSGSLGCGAGVPLAESGLAMECRLRARGRQGELLKYLGALDAAEDDLGYSACTLPIRIGGTLARPEASELSVRLEALALEKGGVGERASELFNRLLGGGK